MSCLDIIGFDDTTLAPTFHVRSKKCAPPES